jgi:hypothetical protein
MPITHAFTSAVTDLADPDEVGPDEWNADHDGAGPFEERTASNWTLQSGVTDLESDGGAGQSYIHLTDTDVSLTSGTGSYVDVDTDYAELNSGAGLFYLANDVKHFISGGAGVVVPLISGGDPAGGSSQDGQVFYDTDKHIFRGRKNGAWSYVGDTVFVAPTANTAINSITDVSIVSQSVPAIAGDQLIVDAWFHILNNSTATRVYNISLDFDGVYPAEFITGALATSSTLLHPMHLTGVFDIRSTSLTYGAAEIDGIPAAGIADDANMTMGTTGLHARTWGTQTTDVTPAVTVSLAIRSANATATQTLHLTHFSIRRLTT